MKLRVDDIPEQERFAIQADGRPAGFVQYRLKDGRIVLEHTEIDPEFEGLGLGAALIRHALDEARARGLDVVPVCPFVRGYIARHHDYLDLVPADVRHRFDLPAASESESRPD